MAADGAAAQAGGMNSTPTLQRPRSGRVIAGVCAALADRFGWSRTLVRVLFVASILLPGPQVIFYLIAWIIIPQAPLPTVIAAPAPGAPGTVSA